MSRKPKQGDFIHFDVEQPKGKIRAINARIEGAKASTSFNVSKGYKHRSSNKFIFAAVIVSIAAFTFERIDIGLNKQSPQPKFSTTLTKAITTQQFTCDGRQYCSQMRSRAEAEYFIKHCPNAKMDGDEDGIPCENDPRF